MGTSKQTGPLFGFLPPRRQPEPSLPLNCIRLEMPQVYTKLLNVT